MLKSSRFIALFALALTLLPGASAFTARADGPAAPAAAPAPAPNRIAVVDIVRVFSRLDEKNRGDDEIEALGKKIAAEKTKKEEALKSLEDGLKDPLFKPDSQDYKNQQDQVLQAEMDLQVFLAVSEQKLLLMQRSKTETIYRSMLAAIKKYAEDNGIALVFVIDNPDFANAKDVKTLTSLIAMSKILYAHPSYDITKNIIEKMNAENHPPTP